MGAQVLSVVSDIAYLIRLVEGIERPVTEQELRNHLRLLVDVYRACPQTFSWDDVLSLVATVRHYLGEDEERRAASLLGLD